MRRTQEKELDDSHPSKKVFRLLDEANTMTCELKSLTAQHAGKLDRLAQIFDSIRKEIATIRDSKFMTYAQFIEPNQLFENGKFPGESGKPNTGAEGCFGRVFEALYHGQKVAVKTPKIDGDANEREDFLEEIEILHSLSHENIVTFRGWGRTENRIYLVMEYMEKDLQQYVSEHNNHENNGLSVKTTWDVSKQICQAMDYLHCRHIVHADLHPNNILIDTDHSIPKAKICDFGRAWRDDLGSRNRSGHMRFGPPIQERKQAKSLEDFMKHDVYNFGLVVLFTKTGIRPYESHATADLQGIKTDSKLSIDDDGYCIREIEQKSRTSLDELIKSCLIKKPTDRPLFPEIRKTHYAQNEGNPFAMTRYYEFFECGILEDTQIYVADSVVKERQDPEAHPVGYDRKDLICEVETGKTNDKNKPEEEELHLSFLKNHRSIQEKIRNKTITEHVAVALTSQQLYSTERSTNQRVLLRFKDINYSHHRAMRAVWRSMDFIDKRKAASRSLGQVNAIFSTSFGVHIAIITNEEKGSRPKFVFAERTEKIGSPSPGMFTCGAVRGCKAEDYLTSEEKRKYGVKDVSKTYISLLKAAANGLDKEISLSLNDKESQEITFLTLYLKFDTHEWGIGGFVNLSNEKIGKGKRFDFKTLNNMFKSSTKDRYENCRLHGVDFTLQAMAEWIRKNHGRMASSTKIVAVKVMQAYFGKEAVLNALKK